MSVYLCVSALSALRKVLYKCQSIYLGTTQEMVSNTLKGKKKESVFEVYLLNKKHSR